MMTWKTGYPTVEEVEAHAKQHPFRWPSDGAARPTRGLWMLHATEGQPTVVQLCVWPDRDGVWVDPLHADVPVENFVTPMARWCPLTATGDPVPDEETPAGPVVP